MSCPVDCIFTSFTLYQSLATVDTKFRSVCIREAKSLLRTLGNAISSMFIEACVALFLPTKEHRETCFPFVYVFLCPTTIHLKFKGLTDLRVSICNCHKTWHRWNIAHVSITHNLFDWKLIAFFGLDSTLSHIHCSQFSVTRFVYFSNHQLD